MATIKRHGVDVSSLYTPAEYSAISLSEMAHDGETGQGTITIPDPAGTQVAYSGQSLEVSVGSTVVWSGFIGGHTRTRGEAGAGTRLLNTHPAVDQNARLTGFRAVAQSRPAETDYARMLWFFTTYLSGINTTWVLNTHTQTLLAKIYNTESLFSELMSDVQDLTGKTAFVENGRAHWHLMTEGIASGMTISDTSYDGVTSFFPMTPSRVSDPLNLRVDVLIENSAGDSVHVTSSTGISEHDSDGIKHEALLSEPTDTSAMLAIKAAAYLANNDEEWMTYECDIGPLTAAQVAAMPAGSLVTATSAVWGLSGATQRIGERTLTIKHPNTFYLHLWLGYPVRRGSPAARINNPIPGGGGGGGSGPGGSIGSTGGGGGGGCCPELCGITDTFNRSDIVAPSSGTSLGVADCGVAWAVFNSEDGGFILSEQAYLATSNDTSTSAAYLPAAITFPIGEAVDLTGLGQTSFFGCQFNSAAITATATFTPASPSTTLVVSDGTNTVTVTTASCPTAPFTAILTCTAGTVVLTVVGGVTLTATLSAATPSAIADLTSASNPFLGGTQNGGGYPKFNDLDVKGLDRCTLGTVTRWT